jgi:hypothetical protein
MYRVILCVVAALSAFGMAATPAVADDNSTCASGAGDEAIAACSRLIAENPKNIVAYNSAALPTATGATGTARSPTSTW